MSDILEAVESIERFCDATTKANFLEDELRQSAILQKLIIIGEAASHLTGDFQKQHPEIEWQDIIGFRNLAVHEYFAIMWDIVWTTATKDVPPIAFV